MEIPSGLWRIISGLQICGLDCKPVGALYVLVVMICELFPDNIDDNFMELTYANVFFALDAVLQVDSHPDLDGDR